MVEAEISYLRAWCSILRLRTREQLHDEIRRYILILGRFHALQNAEGVWKRAREYPARNEWAETLYHAIRLGLLVPAYVHIASLFGARDEGVECIRAGKMESICMCSSYYLTLISSAGQFQLTCSPDTINTYRNLCKKLSEISCRLCLPFARIGTISPGGTKWDQAYRAENTRESPNSLAATCEANTQCFQFFFDRESCFIGKAIRLGEMRDPEDGKRWRSGWNQGRIAAEQEPCDDVKFPNWFERIG